MSLDGVSGAVSAQIGALGTAAAAAGRAVSCVNTSFVEADSADGGAPVPFDDEISTGQGFGAAGSSAASGIAEEGLLGEIGGRTASCVSAASA